MTPEEVSRIVREASTQRKARVWREVEDKRTGEVTREIEVELSPLTLAMNALYDGRGLSRTRRVSER